MSLPGDALAQVRGTDMIVRYLEHVIGGERDVAWGHGQSRRLLLARDGMGFGLTDTTVEAGTAVWLQYTDRLMAAYVLSGEGQLETEDGTFHPLTSGTLYALDKHDRYALHAKTQLRVVCVFNPPLEQ